MLPGSARKTNLMLLLGFVTMLGGYRVAKLDNVYSDYATLPLMLSGLVIWTTGCCAYVVGKGYSRAWGWLGPLAFYPHFPWIFLLPLALLPDRHRRNEETPSLAEEI